MNERTQMLSTVYKPELAIMVYHGGDKKYYLESHTVNEEGHLMEGKPLLQETLDGIVDVFFDERKSRVQIGGYIPDNLLQYDVLPGGKYRMVWYRPAEERVLHFSTALHMPSGKAWAPAMLYVAENKSLAVYALKSDARPKQNTQLYKAPFHNIYSNGNVCLGSAKTKKPDHNTYEAHMRYWEDMFWLSEFTHLNGNGNPTRTNLTNIWKKLINSKRPIKWSSLNELIAIKKTTIKSLTS